MQKNTYVHFRFPTKNNFMVMEIIIYFDLEIMPLY